METTTIDYTAALKAAVGTQNSLNIINKLKEIVALVSSDSEKQESLISTAAYLRELLLTILASNQFNSESTSVVLSTSEDPANIVKVIEFTLLCCLKLCRRETLQKATANTANIKIFFEELDFTDVIFSVVENIISSTLTGTAGVLEHCCSCIMVSCSDNAPQQHRCASVRSSKGLQSIIQWCVSTTTTSTSTTSDPDDRFPVSKVAEMACRCVRNISADDDAQAELIVNSAVAPVTDTSPDRVRATDEDTEPESPISSNNIVKCIIDLSRCFVKSPVAGGGDSTQEVVNNFAVMEAVVYALINLSCDDGLAVIIGAGGGCMLPLNIMDQWLIQHRNYVNCDDETYGTAGLGLALSTVAACLLLVRNLSGINFNLNIYATHCDIVCKSLVDVFQYSYGIEAQNRKNELLEQCCWCLSNLSNKSSFVAYFSQEALPIENVMTFRTENEVGIQQAPLLTTSMLLFAVLTATYYNANDRQEEDFCQLLPCVSGESSPCTFLPGPLAEAAVWWIKALVAGNKALQTQFGSPVATGFRTSVCEMVCKLLDHYRFMPIMTDTLLNTVVLLCYEHVPNRQLFFEMCSQNLIPESDPHRGKPVSSGSEPQLESCTSIVNILYEVIALHNEEEGSDLMELVLKCLYLLCFDNVEMQDLFLAYRPPKLAVPPLPPMPTAEADAATEMGDATMDIATLSESKPLNNILVYVRNIMYCHNRSPDVVRLGLEMVLLLHYSRHPEKLQALMAKGVVVDVHNLPKMNTAAAAAAGIAETDTETEAMPMPPAPPSVEAISEQPTVSDSSDTDLADVLSKANIVSTGSADKPEYHVILSAGFQIAMDIWDINSFIGEESAMFVPAGGP